MAQSLPGSIESTDLHSHMNMRIGIWISGAKYCSQISPAFAYELQMVDKEFGEGLGNARTDLVLIDRGGMNAHKYIEDVLLNHVVPFVPLIAYWQQFYIDGR
jgi:hypothetical protein